MSVYSLELRDNSGGKGFTSLHIKHLKAIAGRPLTLTNTETDAKKDMFLCVGLQQNEGWNKNC